ncbi:MAG: FlgB family protein [Pseudomonadota bacterium]
MYQSLELFQTAGEMARHAGARQAVVARNIANADTPGFQAQMVAPFTDVYRAEGQMGLRMTRAGHLAGQAAGPTTAQAVTATSPPSPNGNTVSIEEEMMNAIAVGREHSRALAIYQHAMTVLRTSLGRN